MLLGVMPSIIMLSLIMYAEYRYDQQNYIKFHYDDCHYVEFHFPECCYAECHGAVLRNVLSHVPMHFLPDASIFLQLAISNPVVIY
jgi:hypothetical protein